MPPRPGDAAPPAVTYCHFPLLEEAAGLPKHTALFHTLMFYTQPSPSWNSFFPPPSEEGFLPPSCTSKSPASRAGWGFRREHSQGSLSNPLGSVRDQHSRWHCPGYRGGVKKMRNSLGPQGAQSPPDPSFHFNSTSKYPLRRHFYIPTTKRRKLRLRQSCQCAQR